MLISRENYALLHMWGGHEGHANNEYILLSGMLITRVDCTPLHIGARAIKGKAQVEARLTPPPRSQSLLAPQSYLKDKTDPTCPFSDISDRVPAFLSAPAHDDPDSDPLPVKEWSQIPFAAVSLPTLLDLTPDALRTLISSDYGNHLVFLNVSADQYEAWLRGFPDLLDATSNDTRLIHVTHAYTSLKDASGKTITVPGLIVKCIPSPWHEACASYIVSKAIEGVASISPGGLRRLGLTCRVNWEFSNSTPTSDKGNELSRTAIRFPM